MNANALMLNAILGVKPPPRESDEQAITRCLLADPDGRKAETTAVIASLKSDASALATIRCYWSTLDQQTRSRLESRFA